MSKKPITADELKKWKKYGRAKITLHTPEGEGPLDAVMLGRYLRLIEEITNLQEELVELRRMSFSRRWRAVECPWCNQDRRSSCKNSKCKGNTD